MFNHYIKIPYEVIKSKDLNATDKLILGITQLYAIKTGFAFFTNGKVASILNITTRTVVSSIAKLKKFKMINVFFRDGKRFIKPLYGCKGNYIKVPVTILESKELTMNEKIALSTILFYSQKVPIKKSLIQKIIGLNYKTILKIFNSLVIKDFLKDIDGSHIINKDKIDIENLSEDKEVKKNIELFIIQEEGKKIIEEEGVKIENKDERDGGDGGDSFDSKELDDNIYICPTNGEQVGRDKIRITKDKIKLMNEVISFLNETCGTRYILDAMCKHLLNKILKNFTVYDIKKVIYYKKRMWGHTEKCIYLRPKTLFGANFISYLNEADLFLNYENRGVL